MAGSLAGKTWQAGNVASQAWSGDSLIAPTGRARCPRTLPSPRAALLSPGHPASALSLQHLWPTRRYQRKLWVKGTFKIEFTCILLQCIASYKECKRPMQKNYS